MGGAKIFTFPFALGERPKIDVRRSEPDRPAEIGNLDGWITRGDRRWKIGTGQETSNQNRLREPSPCRIAKTIITGSSNKNMKIA